jgi:hypothetical protein
MNVGEYGTRMECVEPISRLETTGVPAARWPKSEFPNREFTTSSQAIDFLHAERHLPLDPAVPLMYQIRRLPLAPPLKESAWCS